MAGRPRFAAVILPALVLLLGGVPAGCNGGAAPRPDILLVVWDTCRADHLSAYGYGRPTSPHLEALAREGVRYNRCYSPSPWTPPSHGSLFTGLMPSRHGLTMEAPDDTVRRDVPVLAETLRDAGYETACVTANSHISPLTGLSRGFDHFFGLYEKSPKPDGALVREAAEEFLRARAAGTGPRKPLFLFLNFLDTHHTLAPPPTSIARVKPREYTVETVQEVARRVEQRNAMAHNLGISRIDEATIRVLGVAYDAAVCWMDEQTRGVLDAMERHGILENAMVVITSDHGEHLGDHGLLEHRHSVYDSLLHVPLVVRLPGKFEGGRSVDDLVSLMDLYPTILGVAGVPVPSRTGLDAVALGADPGLRRALQAEHGPHLPFLPFIKISFPDVPDSSFEALRRRWTAVREVGARGNVWKLIRIQRADDGGKLEPAGEELYNLTFDPAENRNLLGKGADPESLKQAERLRGLLPAREGAPGK